MTRALASIAAICLGLCSVGTTQAADTKVRIGYTGAAEFATAFVAKERGIFAKRGIDAELTLVAIGSTLPAALVSKSIDVGGATAPSLILAANGGLKLVVVSGVSVVSADLTNTALQRTGLAIKEPKDWEGKKIGVPGVGAALHILMVRWLKTNGVDPSKVTFVEVSFPTHLDTLKAGTVDVVVTAQPNIDRIINAGAGTVAADLGAMIVGRGGVYWASTAEWAKANAEVAKNFKESLREAGAIVIANPAQAKEDTAKYLKLPPAAAASLMMPKPNADVVADDLDWWIQTLADQNLVDKKLVGSDFIVK